MVYIGPLESQSFKLFRQEAEDFMQDDHIDFVHAADPALAGKVLNVHGPVVRVYRYRQGADFRETSNIDETLAKFIVRSTFTGPTKGILRELSIETAAKIFQYNLPVLLLFRNTSEAKTHTYYEKEFTSAAQRVDEEILVCLADINNEISKKFAMLLGLEYSDFPQVRILDPNPGKQHVLKYVYN